MAKKPDTPCAGGCGRLLWRGRTSAEHPVCRPCRRAHRPQQQSVRQLVHRSCVGCGARFMPRLHIQVRCKKGCGKAGGRAHRSCEICGTIYKPTHKDQRTCGRACGVELRRTVTMTVNHCGRRGKPRSQWPSSKVCFKICPCGALFAGRSSRARYCGTCRAKGSVHCIMLRYYSDPAFRDDVIAKAQARRASKLGLGNLEITIAYLMRRDHKRCGLCRRPVRGKAGMRGPSIDHIIPLSRGGKHELANVHLAHLECNLRKHAGGGGEQLMLIG